MNCSSLNFIAILTLLLTNPIFLITLVQKRVLIKKVENVLLMGDRIVTQHNEIPSDGDYTIVIDPVEVRGTAFLHEQPTGENDSTITVYLEDPAPGQAVFRFDLYAVPK